MENNKKQIQSSVERSCDDLKSMAGILDSLDACTKSTRDYIELKHREAISKSNNK